MFKLYDISMTITEQMTVWKDRDNKRPVFENISNFETGTSYGSRLHLDAHTGTHLDAPLHMLEDGAAFESIPLERLISPARVLDLTHVKDSITQTDLESWAIQPGEWILFKTRNSFRAETDPFDQDFVFLREDGARYLAEIGIQGVGTDSLGIERSQPEHPTHRALMRKDVLILEGLQLNEVAAGSYWMVLAPLKLAGVEASPARVFLLGN